MMSDLSTWIFSSAVNLEKSPQGICCHKGLVNGCEGFTSRHQSKTLVIKGAIKLEVYPELSGSFQTSLPTRQSTKQNSLKSGSSSIKSLPSNNSRIILEMTYYPCDVWFESIEFFGIMNDFSAWSLNPSITPVTSQSIKNITNTTYTELWT